MTGRAGRVLRDGALWGGASALVLALHLGGALWILRQAEAAAPPGLPRPVLVDLVPAEVPQDAPAREPVPEPAARPALPEDTAETRPQPEPEPEDVAEPLELPPLRQLEPLDDMAELFPPAPPDLEAPPQAALTASVRPERRPERQVEPRRDERREAGRQRRAEPGPQQQPALQQPARRAPQGEQGGTGRSGISTQQRNRDEASWQRQVGACILRSASRVSGAKGARSAVALVIARNGRVQSASLTASTGNARVDREITRAMGRARCPAAPPGLTGATYDFVQPFTIR